MGDDLMCPRRHRPHCTAGRAAPRRLARVEVRCGMADDTTSNQYLTTAQVAATHRCEATLCRRNSEAVGWMAVG